jgi:hypothetical protein
MKILIGCEYSGVVRRAFDARGHDVISCDLLPSEDDSPYHYQGDIRDMLAQSWDMALFFPPCTHLAASGARHFARKRESGEQQEALEFVRMLLGAGIPKICLENPVGIISTQIRKPDQVIQPYWFGHDASKKTCLWLKGLPKLVETNRLPGDDRTRRANQTPSGQNRLGPSPGRWKERSRTYGGIGQAMAEQWG